MTAITTDITTTTTTSCSFSSSSFILNDLINHNHHLVHLAEHHDEEQKKQIFSVLTSNNNINNNKVITIKQEQYDHYYQKKLIETFSHSISQQVKQQSLTQEQINNNFIQGESQPSNLYEITYDDNGETFVSLVQSQMQNQQIDIQSLASIPTANNASLIENYKLSDQDDHYNGVMDVMKPIVLSSQSFDNNSSYYYSITNNKGETQNIITDQNGKMNKNTVLKTTTTTSTIDNNNKFVQINKKPKTSVVNDSDDMGKIHFFQCFICNSKYETKKSLNAHYNSIHKKPNEKKLHHCSWPGCSYYSNRMSSLKRHQIVHSTECQYVCKVEGCGKKYKSATGYKKHIIRFHTNTP